MEIEYYNRNSTQEKSAHNIKGNQKMDLQDTDIKPDKKNDKSGYLDDSTRIDSTIEESKD